METNLIGKRALVVSMTEGKITREISGVIAALGYYGGDAIKAYHRGFDILLQTPDGKLHRVSSNDVKLLN